MAIQIQRFTNAAWRVVLTLPTLNAKQEQAIRSADFPCRAIDCTADRVLVRNNAARAIPKPIPNKGVDRPMSFSPAKIPEIAPPSRVMRTRVEGTYPTFSDT
ncbi:hypothetical protein P1J78_20895 [Psychromarinibacter sp. C21-152]|uniref:Uncharacterized protein n=1 Tax=Psychromarinibacter sediminicola TaxID=3033385 RepID=A0AAE3TC21_9RHOB|nr:hypothetical protein [Psychromarinibacter sediminicola]MDF0603205.1 hypothetical protein [Psychromarinibacter sediminicola]